MNGATPVVQVPVASHTTRAVVPVHREAGLSLYGIAVRRRRIWVAWHDPEVEIDLTREAPAPGSMRRGERRAVVVAGLVVLFLAGVVFGAWRASRDSVHSVQVVGMPVRVKGTGVVAEMSFVNFGKEPARVTSISVDGQAQRLEDLVVNDDLGRPDRLAMSGQALLYDQSVTVVAVPLRCRAGRGPVLAATYVESSGVTGAAADQVNDTTWRRLCRSDA